MNAVECSINARKIECPLAKPWARLCEILYSSQLRTPTVCTNSSCAPRIVRLSITSGYGSKLNHQEFPGFSAGSHLPGFHLGYLFLTHSQVTSHGHLPAWPSGALQTSMQRHWRNCAKSFSLGISDMLFLAALARHTPFG